MLSVALILVVAAIIVTIVSAMGRCPLWIAVMLLAIVAALGVLPLK